MNLAILPNQALIIQRGNVLALRENLIQKLVDQGKIEYCAACDAYHLEPGVTWEQLEKENTLTKITLLVREQYSRDDMPPAEASGEIFQMPKFPGIDWVIYRAHKQWRVMEKTTGLSPGYTIAKTRKESLAMADKNLGEFTLESIQGFIATSKKLNPSTP